MSFENVKHTFEEFRREKQAEEDKIRKEREELARLQMRDKELQLEIQKDQNELRSNKSKEPRIAQDISTDTRKMARLHMQESQMAQETSRELNAAKAKSGGKFVRELKEKPL